MGGNVFVTHTLVHVPACMIPPMCMYALRDHIWRLVIYSIIITTRFRTLGVMLINILHLSLFAVRNGPRDA